MSEHKRIFISHSSHDKPLVNRLLRSLQDFGIDDAWYDVREISATSNLPTAMSDGIKSADYFVIFISRRSASSPWVSFEINEALELNKPVIAVLFVADDKSVIFDNPFLNSALQGGRLNVLNFGEDFDKSLIQLLRTIAPEIGASAEIEMRFKTILYGDDPDVAEREMGFAALQSEAYLARLLILLGDLRNSRILRYRAGRLCCHIGDATVGPLFSVLTLNLSIPEKDIAPPPSSVQHAEGMLTGQSALDYIRWIIFNPVAQKWSAMLGAEYCLVAMGRHNPRLKRISWR